MIRLAEAVGALETPACRSDAAPAEACSLLAGCGGAQGEGGTSGVADSAIS